jgi:hypothetical protein
MFSSTDYPFPSIPSPLHSPSHLRLRHRSQSHPYPHTLLSLHTDSSMKADLSRLNYWAVVRHKYRNKKNALDQYLRHKTELSLSVRTDQKTMKYVVSGFTTWSNATSMSLVSEYMILMCETVGGMCEGLKAPVLYKTQSPMPPLSSELLNFIFIFIFMFAGLVQYSAVFCTALHCTTLYCTTLHCTALHYTVLHYTKLHCTALC